MINTQNMRRLFALLSLLAAIITGCNTKEPLPEEPKMVQVVLNYALPESGSMTKATAAEVYDTIYETYIKTGELLPNPYSLTFKTMDGVEVARISGNWSDNKPVMIATGKYHVVGSSNGGVTYREQFTKAPLLFEEDIEIDENTASITLHAKYDCFLLIFDAEGKTYFKWSADGTSDSAVSGDAGKVGNWYYIFAKEFKGSGSVQWNYGSKENRIWMSNFNFQKGYYYYYNDLSGSFEIPKMQPGSI